MSGIVTARLENGLTIVAEPIGGVRTAAVTWFVPGGGAEDPPDQLGRAALWHELLMRGAGELGSREQADAFDRLGCGRSVSAGTYFMRIGASMLGDRLCESLPLLVGMVRQPRFDEAAIEPAKDLAIQAIESLKDDPQERAMIAARRRHYSTPHNRSGLGEIEHIERMTRHQLATQWAAIAKPRRSIFAVAGAIEPSAVVDQLRKLLAGWEGGTPEPVTGSGGPRGSAHEEDPSNQVQIVLLHDAPSEAHPDSILEKVVINVLSGGMSGRLFTEVREKRGLCYAVSASYRGDRDFGSGLAYVGTTPERAQQSLEVLLAELERINTPGGAITSDEFERAIVGMKSRLVFSGESTSARSAALASDQHRLGRARTLDELAQQVDRITLDQVNAYLRRRSLGALTIQTLGPTPLKPPAR